MKTEPVPFAVRLRTLFAHNFCPNTDRAIVVLRNPVAVLCYAAILSGLSGVFLHANGFVLCSGVLTVLAVGIAWPWLSLRGLRATLTFGVTRITEGETVTVQLILTNRSPLGCWGLRLHGLDKVPLTAHAPGWRESRWSFPIVLPRGEYPHGSVYLVSGFPFGLWSARRRVRVSGALLVWPRTSPVGPVPESSGTHSIEGTVSRNRIGVMGDLLGVRPYRRGDSPRRIHWAQTARHDRLIVCELQAQARPLVQIVVDLHSANGRGLPAQDTTEWIIRIAASLCSGWIEQGAPVGAIFGEDAFAPQSGARQRRDLLDAFARLARSAAREKPRTPTLAELLQMPAVRSFEGIQVVVAAADAVSMIDPLRECMPHRRFIVLRWNGFAELTTAQRRGVDAVHPWIIIDDPATIPDALRRQRKELEYAR